MKSETRNIEELENQEVKTCTHCLLSKPLDDFYKHKSKSGYRAHCKECVSKKNFERNDRYTEEAVAWLGNLYSGEELTLQVDKLKSASKKDISRKRNELFEIFGEKFNEQIWKHEYYLRNKEKINEANKDWYEKNKESVKSKQLQYREQNKEAIALMRKRWVIENYLRNKLNGSRGRAKARGLPFNIELEDLDLPDVCPVLGIPLQISRSGSQSSFSPSLDKIIPERGYVKGNVQIISARANKMKADASPLELLLFAYWVLDNFDSNIYLQDSDIASYFQENLDQQERRSIE